MNLLTTFCAAGEIGTVFSFTGTCTFTRALLSPSVPDRLKTTTSTAATPAASNKADNPRSQWLVRRDLNAPANVFMLSEDRREDTGQVSARQAPAVAGRPAFSMLSHRMRGSTQA